MCVRMLGSSSSKQIHLSQQINQSTPLVIISLGTKKWLEMQHDTYLLIIRGSKTINQSDQNDLYTQKKGVDPPAATTWHSLFTRYHEHYIRLCDTGRRHHDLSQFPNARFDAPLLKCIFSADFLIIHFLLHATDFVESSLFSLLSLAQLLAIHGKSTSPSHCLAEIPYQFLDELRPLQKKPKQKKHAALATSLISPWPRRRQRSRPHVDQ